MNCDESRQGEKIINQDVSRVLKVSKRMIDRVQQRFVEEGFESCLERKTLSGTKVKKIDGELEAPWKVKGWIIPPLQNSEFVANMEQVLDVYKRPYNSVFQ